MRIHRRAILIGALITIALVSTSPPQRASADPELPLPRLPICGDQDGSESPLFLRCPDFVPATDVQAYQVPGEETQSLRFDFVFREAAFNDELGFFVVDSAEGEIGGLRPGDSDYLAAAYERAAIVFPSGSNAFTPDVFVDVDGGDILVFFIVQNNTFVNLLASNPFNELGKSPLAFFSLDSLNPDGVDHFVGYKPVRINISFYT